MELLQSLPELFAANLPLIAIGGGAIAATSSIASFRTRKHQKIQYLSYSKELSQTLLLKDEQLNFIELSFNDLDSMQEIEFRKNNLRKAQNLLVEIWAIHTEYFSTLSPKRSQVVDGLAQMGIIEAKMKTLRHNMALASGNVGELSETLKDVWSGVKSAISFHGPRLLQTATAKYLAPQDSTVDRQLEMY